jgi:hypothetical protein
MPNNSPLTVAQLSYAQVTFKASHNAYDRDEMPVSCQYEYLGSDSDDWQGGCRGLELDLNLSTKNWLWSVNHLGGYQGATDLQFVTYLADLAEWHADNSAHDLMTITLDLKSSDPLDKKSRPSISEFAERLDETIEAAFQGEPFFSPADLQGQAATLLKGAEDWPVLDKLRGRFLFCLSGDEGLKTTYLKASGKRLCFADKKFDVGDQFKPEASPDRVFYNFDLDAWDLAGNQPGWVKAVKQIAKDGRCVTRGYLINNSVVWDAATAAGVSVLATDKVTNHKWATVGPGGFIRRANT